MSSELDPTVAKILDKERPDSHDDDDDDDDKEDELFDELEADEAALDALREKRMQQLHEEINRARQMRSLSHGALTTCTTEKELMDITTSTHLTVAHFFHPDFRRCQIMDRHLETLAPKHFDTRFARIHVESAPFLVERLKIVVLPCLISFVDGKSVDRIEGFAELGNTDGFGTAMLEARLLAVGALVRAKVEGTSAGEKREDRGRKGGEESDDSDWD